LWGRKKRSCAFSLGGDPSCAASAGCRSAATRVGLGVDHVEAADDGIARDDEQRGKARRRGDDVLEDAAVSRKLCFGALLILAKGRTAIN
jgi:hypothetical protein